MDANIVRPLTAPNKLSYAELVGPQDAMWFVSHWWGSLQNAEMPVGNRWMTLENGIGKMSCWEFKLLWTSCCCCGRWWWWWWGGGGGGGGGGGRFCPSGVCLKYLEATVAHPTLWTNSHALRIHGTIVYLPTWMVDFFGKCTLPETKIVAENRPDIPKGSWITFRSHPFSAVNSLLASWRVSPNVPVPWILWKLLVYENSTWYGSIPPALPPTLPCGSMPRYRVSCLLRSAFTTCQGRVVSTPWMVGLGVVKV